MNVIIFDYTLSSLRNIFVRRSNIKAIIIWAFIIFFLFRIWNLYLTKLRYLIILRHFINSANYKSIIIWIILILYFLFPFLITIIIFLLLWYLFLFLIRCYFSLFFIIISVFFSTHIWLIISNFFMRTRIIIIRSEFIIILFNYWKFIITA